MVAVLKCEVIPASVLQLIVAGNQTRSRYTGNEYLNIRWRNTSTLKEQQFLIYITHKTPQNLLYKHLALTFVEEVTATATSNLFCLQSTNIWLTKELRNQKIFTRTELGHNVNSQMKDTVDNQKTKVPEQEDSEDEGRVAHNIPRGFMFLDTPAAPGGRHSRSVWCRKYDIMSSTSWLTLWQHRRKTCHWRWLTASGKAQWMGWRSSGSPPPAYFCQSAEPLVTARTQTRQRVEGSPMSTRMCSMEGRNVI